MLLGARLPSPDGHPMVSTPSRVNTSVPGTELTVTDAAGFVATASETLVVAVADGIFSDCFESGDTTAWTALVP